MFHSHSILDPTLPTLLPSPLKLQNFTTLDKLLKYLLHVRDRKYGFEINFCVFN